MDNIARAIELIGSAITTCGLAYAYTRATGSLEVWVARFGRIWRRITRQSQSATVHVTAAAAGAGALSVDAYAVFQLDPDMPVQDQLNAIAEFCRESQAQSSQIRQRFAAHDRDIASAREHAEQLAGQARDGAAKDLQTFSSALDDRSALDLRVAISGVAITTVGIALGFLA
ncbi:hypothetical protein [Nocardia salmonicida]|uniref:hypothetical protein n=1 Tax=Nocardia salmonicida TaxID=53431 RepID=UPI0033D889AD